MPTDFRVADQDWFKTGMEAKGPQWFRVLDHPIGPRPSIAFAGPIDVYQQRQGVLAIIIEYTRLSRFLAQLEVGKTGTAFILDESGELIAAPDKNADELHPARKPAGDAAAGPDGAGTRRARTAARKPWRRASHLDGAAYEVALTPLPFSGWSLATVIPEAEFLGPVDTTLRRLIIGLAVGALLAALLSAMLVRSVIAVPARPRRRRNPACRERSHWIRFAVTRRGSPRYRVCRARSPKWPRACPLSANSFQPTSSDRCCVRVSRRSPAARSRS